MRINTNINSMRTQEYMRQNQAKMSNAMDRLSSGKRINNASDDAAGLAIATRMRARESGLGVAANNTQDGMSLIRTADSAMNSVSNILLRMRDIANQSANGTNTDQNKVALQKEFGELQKQITYIADNTQFNDKNLLKQNQSINIQTLDSSSESKQIAIDLKAVTLDKLGIKDISIGNTSTKAVDFQEFKDSLKALQNASADADTRASDVQTAKDAFAKIKDQFDTTDRKKIQDSFDAYDADSTVAKAGLIYTNSNALNTDVDKKFGLATTAITALKTAADNTDISAAKTAFDNIKDHLSKSDAKKLEEAFTKAETSKKDVDIQAINTAFTGMKTVDAPATNVDALAAVNKIDEALKTVADNRATLGATLNRLDFNVNNLKSQASSMASAASQIEDADMAKEMSEMTKFKILNEAGISMLSQANQTPQMVSKLLQ
ncbi:flagellin [Bacillus cereus]|uniref:flagellin N-terminal helical domain-containing protein n=1 Tax=Bacillus cereus TaxID=1396 RepID=UPI0018F74E43|nr:flagellin [Bacillus cereus]